MPGFFAFRCRRVTTTGELINVARMRTSSIFLVTVLSSIATLHCSSSDSDTATTTTPGADSGQNTSDSDSGAAGDSAASTTTATVSDVAIDQTNAIVYLGALPSGNLIGTEGNGHRVLELEPTGHVVNVNDTDFTGSNWPRHVAVNESGHVFINGYGTVILYDSGIKGAKKDYVPVDGNKQIDAIAYGGNPKRLWAVTANNPTAPKMNIVRYDAATATEAGAPTVVAELEKVATQSMTVDAANNAYVVDFNGCRIVKISTAGQVSVIAGPALGQSGSCVIGAPSKGTEGARIGQGSSIGLDPSGTKLWYSDTRNKMILDVTEESDGLSRIAPVATFDAAVENGYFVSTAAAAYVVDSAAHGLKKLTF